jgi:hypothetical protein
MAESLDPLTTTYRHATWRRWLGLSALVLLAALSPVLIENLGPLGWLAAAYWMFFAWRAFTVALTIGPQGVVVRRLFSTVHARWEDVLAFEIRRQYGSMGRPVICIRLREGKIIKTMLGPSLPSGLQGAAEIVDDLNIELRRRALTEGITAAELGT